MITTTQNKMLAALAIMKTERPQAAVRNLLCISKDEYQVFKKMVDSGLITYYYQNKRVVMEVNKSLHPLVKSFNIPDLNFHLPAYTVHNFSELTVGNYKERNGV